MAGLTTLTCPKCSHRFRVATPTAGRSLGCPACSAVLRLDDGLNVKVVKKPAPPTPETHRPQPSSQPPSKPMLPPIPPQPEPDDAPVSLQIPAESLPFLVLFGGAFIVLATLVAGNLLFTQRRPPLPESNQAEARQTKEPKAPQPIEMEKASVERPPTAAQMPPTASDVRSPQPQPPSPPARPAGRGTDPVHDALQSVATVHSPTSHGSGFMAARHLLVANHHVIEGDLLSNMRVRFPDNTSVSGRDFDVELVIEDPPNDLAVLEVNCDVPPLSIKDSYSHTNGQKIVAIGSPGTGAHDGTLLPNFTTDGRLGPPIQDEAGVTSWSLSIAVNPGNSGGPVVDASTADVIGVVSKMMVRTQAQGAAVPHPELVRILRAAKSATQTERQRNGSFHRQRWCFHEVADRIDDVDIAFAIARKAAMETEDDSPRGRLEAFQNAKAICFEEVSGKAERYRAYVLPELARLGQDSFCDSRARSGFLKLSMLLDSLIADLKRAPSLDGVKNHLEKVDASIATSKEMADALGERLGTEFNWSMNE